MVGGETSGFPRKSLHDQGAHEVRLSAPRQAVFVFLKLTGTCASRCCIHLALLNSSIEGGILRDAAYGYGDRPFDVALLLIKNKVTALPESSKPDLLVQTGAQQRKA